MVPNKLSVQARSMPMYWQDAQGIYARCTGMGKRCPPGMVIVCLVNGVSSASIYEKDMRSRPLIGTNIL